MTYKFILYYTLIPSFCKASGQKF